MGILEKFSPMGYVTPGNFRRFIPKSGSGYFLSFTSAETTVVGAVTEYHVASENAGVEICSPGFSTLHDDSIRHPSRRCRTPFAESAAFAGNRLLNKLRPSTTYSTRRR